jgi:hypothetical protein
MSSVVVLSSRGFSHLSLNESQCSFSFYVDEHVYSCHFLLAEYISPKVALLRQSDLTINELHINEHDPTCQFREIMNLCRGESLRVTSSNLDILSRLSSALGNTELLQLIFDQMGTEMAIDAVFARLKLLKLMGADTTREAAFCAEHFYELQLNSDVFDPEILESILACSSLKLNSEDQLYQLIESLISQSSEYFSLLEYVHFELLTIEAMSRAIRLIGSSLDSLNPSIWNQLCSRLFLSVEPTDLSGRYVGKSIDLNPSAPLKGIISYLTDKHGGNVHDRKIVGLTASSTDFGEIRHLVELQNLPGAQFQTAVLPDQWICYDFKNIRVCLRGYTLRSSSNSTVNNYNPQHWVIEGSLDRDSWIILDRRENNSDINGANLKGVFSLVNPKLQFFRFFRFRQTGLNHAKNTAIMLGSWELFGIICE